MFFVYICEATALSLLTYDAKKGRAKLVSAQTCIAFTVSGLGAFLNLPRVPHLRHLKIGISVFNTCMGALGSYYVSKTAETDGKDDLTIPGLPARMYKYVPYVATLIFGLLSLFVGCNFSVSAIFTDKHLSTTDIVCTFQNYMHAFALLPQLVLSRRQGFVAPAALRFLVLIGCKHIYEFFSDAYVSYVLYKRNKLYMEEFSFMSGDLFAALILLDFLYVVAVQRFSFVKLLWKVEAELDLSDESMTKGNSKMVGDVTAVISRVKHVLNDPSQRKQTLVLMAFSGLLVAGFLLNLLDVFKLCLGCIVFAVGRWSQNGQVALPKNKQMMDKVCGYV